MGCLACILHPTYSDDKKMNETTLTTDAETFTADMPSLEGGTGKWAKYLTGTRLLLVSRDEQLKAIHHDASLTQAQKYEHSKALFERTNQIESFLSPAQGAKFKELHPHHAEPSQYLPVGSFFP
jgi:hypothetical protein